MLRINKGQSILVYAVLIAVISLGMIVIFKYIRYAVQGKYRQAGDAFGQGKQYEPGVTNLTDF